MTPVEELEHILAARDFGAQHWPEVLRLLRQVTLVFLLPYHPEIMGDNTVKPDGPLPKFIIWTTKAGERHLPIFTSVRCAREALEKTKKANRRYALGEMEGKELFHLLARQPDGVVVNPACSTKDFYLDHNAVKMLADGSILAPAIGAQKEGNVQIVKPADYPTDFLQPLFRFLRGRPEVRAAWIFRDPDRQDATHYVFVLKIVGPDTGLLQDFRIITSSTRPDGVLASVTLLDPNNTQLVQVTSAHTPFYAAPDYPAPGPLRDEGPGQA